MIELDGIVGIPFLKKSRFTGSDKEKCYVFEKRTAEEETHLAATIWKGPKCFDMTPEEEKCTELFDFTEEGLMKAIDWLNKQTV